MPDQLDFLKSPGGGGETSRAACWSRPAVQQTSRETGLPGTAQGQSRGAADDQPRRQRGKRQITHPTGAPAHRLSSPPPPAPRWPEENSPTHQETSCAARILWRAGQGAGQAAGTQQDDLAPRPCAKKQERSWRVKTRDPLGRWLAGAEAGRAVRAFSQGTSTLEKACGSPSASNASGLLAECPLASQHIERRHAQLHNQLAAPGRTCRRALVEERQPRPPTLRELGPLLAGLSGRRAGVTRGARPVEGCGSMVEERPRQLEAPPLP